MPSRLRFSTPARSLTSSPRRRQHQRHGEAQRRGDEDGEQSRSISAPPLQLLDQDRRARDGDHDQALDDHVSAAGTRAMISMEMPPERRKPNSSAPASDAQRRAARQQADDQAVEAVARGEAGLQVVLLALQHDGAGQPAEARRRWPAPTTSRTPTGMPARREASSLRPTARSRRPKVAALQHDRRGDRQQQARSRRPMCSGDVGIAGQAAAAWSRRGSPATPAASPT